MDLALHCTAWLLTLMKLMTSTINKRLTAHARPYTKLSEMIYYCHLPQEKAFAQYLRRVAVYQVNYVLMSMGLSQL